MRTVRAVWTALAVWAMWHNLNIVNSVKSQCEQREQSTATVRNHFKVIYNNLIIIMMSQRHDVYSIVTLWYCKVDMLDLEILLISWDDASRPRSLKSVSFHWRWDLPVHRFTDLPTNLLQNLPTHSLTDLPIYRSTGLPIHRFTDLPISMTWGWGVEDQYIYNPNPHFKTTWYSFCQ